MTEAGTRAILVFVQIPNPDAVLRGGMFATGRIRLAAGAAVPTLPATAIRNEAGQNFVWTIDDGKLVRRDRDARPARRDSRHASSSRRTLPAGDAGARRALRQPEGRRAGGVCARLPPRQGAPAARLRRQGAHAMWITHVSINNPVFATMVMIGITVLGLFSYNRLRVEQMPDVSLPFVFVVTTYPGASPEVVETDVTKPIEYAINTVSGVKTHPLEVARGAQRGLRRIPARHRHDARDAGRARQDRAGAAGLSRAT